MKRSFVEKGSMAAKVMVAALAVLAVVLSQDTARPVSGVGVNSVAAPDTAGLVGLINSLQLDAAGNPVVSYWDQTNSDLKLLHCDDPACAGDESANITSPDTAGLVGNSSSLQLDAAGNPVISYRDVTNNDLKLLHCDDPGCAGDESANIFSPDTAGNVGNSNSLQLDAAGNPVISYFDDTNDDLKLLHCDDPTCAGDESANITSPDTAGSVGVDTSLQLDAAGNPVVSYRDASPNFDLKLLHCDDPGCVGDESANILSPDTAGNVGEDTSLQLDGAGNPVISYRDVTNLDLKLLHCDDPDCAGDESANSFSPDTAGNVGEYTSLQLDAAGNPVVSYYDATNGDLKLLHCDDPACAGDESANIISPDTAGVVGQLSSLQLDAAGNPVVSYYDVSNADLKLLHCGNANCTIGAYSFEVDSTSDTVDANPGNGVCADGGGDCTLRAAIQESNALGGQQSIGVPVGTYTLTIVGTSEDATATGDLDITDDVSLKGSGAGATVIDGGGIDRVFDVISTSQLILKSVTVTSGSTVSSQDGGGVDVDDGTLTTSDVAIDGNEADGDGGGVWVDTGDLDLFFSTVSNNKASGHGGGIASGVALSTIINSTVSGNSADGSGGGIYFNSSGSPMKLNNATVGENIADADANSSGQGGGIASVGGVGFDPDVGNSIVARNINTLGGAPDCDGTVNSDGYNLIGQDTGCTFNSDTGDQVGSSGSPIDPLYGRLRNNGGPTETHAISVTSPAIDTGDPGASCEPQDQRGETRPKDGDSDETARCDIGAYERQGAIEEPCNAPVGGLCESFRFDSSLTVTSVPPCSADGDLGAERAPTGDDDSDTLDDAHVDLTYLDGYVDCPGDFFIGSSIPSEGIIEEQQNNMPGVLEFPAMGEFTLCLTIASHPFGDLHNCPDDFAVMDKSPMELTCKIYSMYDFECDIAGDVEFFDDNDTVMATVEDGTAELDMFESEGGGKLAGPGDTDGDGCPDESENDPDEMMGGQRDYAYAWDYYDVLGPFQSEAHDGVIDLANDILGVILHYSPAGASPYDVRFDRGVTTGANHWERAGPDGAIDLANDILGVILQFGHNC